MNRPKEISYGYCHCGCGEKAPIATETSKKRGHIPGEPIRFIRGHHLKRGAFLARGKGGFKTYPCQIGIHKKREHVAMAEKALGKPIPNGAEVHHVNGSKDSGPLVICQDRSYHGFLHRRMRALKACGHASWRKCWICKKWDNPEKLSIRKNGRTAHHRDCMNLLNRQRHVGKLHGVSHDSRHYCVKCCNGTKGSTTAL